MLNSFRITFAGNLVEDPELKVINGKTEVTNFTVAYTPREKVPGTEGEYQDGETLFVRVTAWRREAKNVVNSLSKGQRVLLTGNLKPRYYDSAKYTNEDGEAARMLTIEMDVEEIGASLTFATVDVTKNEKSGGQSRSESKPKAKSKPRAKVAEARVDDDF